MFQKKKQKKTGKTLVWMEILVFKIPPGGVKPYISIAYFVHISYLLCVRTEINSHWQVICCFIYHCLSVSRTWINPSRFALMIYSL